MKKTLPIAVLTGLLLAGCTSAADKADHNLSKACDNVECPRRVTAINGITDKVLFTVGGFCSYTDGVTKFSVICKEPDGTVEHTTLGLSDNVTYVVTQLGGQKKVDLFKSRIIFRPETVIPNFDLSTSGG